MSYYDGYDNINTTAQADTSWGEIASPGGDASSRGGSRVPPLKKLQRKGLELPPPPGAPNSTWKLVELKLWMELPTDRVTQHVPEGTWRMMS